MSKTVLVAMSGGVDSSVAAYLLRRDGYECAGATLLLTGGADGDAERTAARLGMPFYVGDYRQAFEERVIQPFMASYRRGETPNPCVLCNPRVKFQALLEMADRLGMEYIATGHYAVTYRDGNSGRRVLCKASDRDKDQSYALYALSQEQLERTLFPLGGLSKARVREIAAEQGLQNAERKDSQDICFVPGGDYAAFIEEHGGAPAEPGLFLDAAGNVIGKHKGQMRYTIGQRKGLGLALKRPLYVAAKDAAANTVTLVENDALYSETLFVGQVNWVCAAGLEAPARVTAKIRYGHREQPATAEREGDGIRITFDMPQRAVTRGQSAVIYDGGRVMCGGIIM